MNEYSAIDIARYVINYSWDINAPLSNLKLQKLLYFIQGNFLRILNRPCFKDDIEAWKYGPVVPTVYSKFKRYGSNNINRIEYIYEFEENKYEAIKKDFKPILSDEEAQIIQGVVSACKDYSANYLVKLTHSQSPWKKSYGKNNNVISIELMREYFCDE